MNGVNKNIQEMIKEGKINDAQNEVLVLLIADGLSKINDDVKEYMT